uniref:Ig-like domain-containing protein n=1 Tax=Suricata suricatta TaxID=37032 RepID=A0A673U412_SURSU
MALLIPSGHLSLEVCPQPDRANIPPRSPQACSLEEILTLSLNQPTVVVGRLGGSATLLCTASESVSYIHWYLHQEGSAPKRILMLDMSRSYVQRYGGYRSDKITAKRVRNTYSCELSLLKLEKRDEGAYYCAAWEAHMFGPGTLLRTTDKNPDEDISPKPTIFLPSIAEVKLHKVGTYVCLLEDFFPDVIEIDWKEKNGKTVLESLQGNTMKTKDTYMKYTWLTVQQESMDREHKCIVKREKKGKNVEQEILFPSLINERMPRDSCTKDAVLLSVRTGETNQWLLLDPLQLQFMNTSAYYTYLLLLVKSMVYTIIITIGLLGRGALCDNGKRS